MALTLVNAPRRLNGWIESFVEATSHTGAPAIFRRWTAISAVAAALEQRVWVVTRGSELYPNLYMLLIAEPGIGKGLALGSARRIFSEIKDLKIAPNSVSKASLMDSLFEAKRKVLNIVRQEFLEYNSLYVVATELGVLIPMWDSEFMNSLTDIYDGTPYNESKRTGKLRIDIPRPQINLIGATTPSYLNQVMPPGAWDQGFISRTILIYSGERTITDVFADDCAYKETHDDLITDFKTISSLQGRALFEPLAAALIQEWHKTGGPPAPTNPKLAHYLTRRTAHVLKISMVMMASRGHPGLIITEEDVRLAIDTLTEAEAAMQDIFLVQGNSEDSRVMDDTFTFVLTTWAKRGKMPVPEGQVVNFLRSRVASHSIMKVLEAMVRSNMIEQEIKNGVAGYRPGPKGPGT
jgi:Protein of unknown function (DUF3987)